MPKYRGYFLLYLALLGQPSPRWARESGSKFQSSVIRRTPQPDLKCFAGPIKREQRKPSRNWRDVPKQQHKPLSISNLLQPRNSHYMRRLEEPLNPSSTNFLRSRLLPKHHSDIPHLCMHIAAHIHGTLASKLHHPSDKVLVRTFPRRVDDRYSLVVRELF